MVFVPLLASHQTTNLHLALPAILGFLAMSAAASSGYIFNDLVDVGPDRMHKYKKTRPIASGQVSRCVAVIHMVGLSLVGLLVPCCYDLRFSGLIILYLIATVGYTVAGKRIAILDVLALALFYVFRIVLGGLFAGIVVTDWLLVCSFFYFLSVAFAKRHGGLADVAGPKAHSPYVAHDKVFLMIQGVGAGVGAVLVLAIYLKSDHVHSLYAKPDWLWFLVISLHVWLMRLWLKASRSELHHDPVTFALKDPISLLLGGVAFMAFALAGALKGGS